jgi:hypothetical protein
MRAIDFAAADNSSIVVGPERWFPSSSFLYRRLYRLRLRRAVHTPGKRIHHRGFRSHDGWKGACSHGLGQWQRSGPGKQPEENSDKCQPIFELRMRAYTT